MKIPVLIASAMLILSNSVWADADGPDVWRVTHVLPDGFLNLRKGPSIQFDIIARIPHDATGLENLGCSPDFNASEWAEFTAEESELALKMRWCRVAYLGEYGWVHSRYLEE